MHVWLDVYWNQLGKGVGEGAAETRASHFQKGVLGAKSWFVPPPPPLFSSPSYATGYWL